MTAPSNANTSGLTPTEALRLVPDEEQIFAWLNRKYVQRADERQRSMNLQYMEAETHDLSASLHRWLLAAAPASPLPGGGEDDTVVDLAEALRLLEEVAPLAICWATHYASSRGFEQHPHHKALNEQIRAFLARNGKGEG